MKLLGPPPACDPLAARRLAREFDALRELHHPNVVRVFEAGVHEGYSFLAMELVLGLDLRSYLSPLLDEPAEATEPGAARSGESSAAPEPFPCPCPTYRHPGASTPAISGSGFTPWASEPETESLPCAVECPCAGAEEIRAFAALMDEPETDPGTQAPNRRTVEPPSPQRLGTVGPLPPAAVERLNRRERMDRLHDAMLQVCDGLAYVHARGLVHRDLKPSNIMVDDGRRVRLMDFGLVKLAGDANHLTLHGRVVGTYRYMAPEQARGEPVDHRADLYSLGVILFELLCGRPPFTSRVAPELWNAIVSLPAPAVLAVNPGASPRLALVAERLLAKDPRDRYQHAGDIAAELRRRTS